MIPFGIDTKLQYKPWCIGSLILLCVVSYVAQGIPDWQLADHWALVHGSGWHVSQWITRHFVHTGHAHLVLNLLFLWTFGMPIEGMLGWRRTLLLLLVLGAGQGMIEQSLPFWLMDGRAVGISSVVCGLMSIALIWFPVANVLFVSPMVLTYPTGDVDPIEIPLWRLALVFFGLDFGLAIWNGFSASRPALHLLGGALGLIAGVALLRLRRFKRHHVDLISLWRKREAEIATNTQRLADRNYRPAEKNPKPTTQFLDRRQTEIRQCLLEHQFERAWQLYKETRSLEITWNLPADLILEFADHLAKQNRSDDECQLLQEYLSQEKSPDGQMVFRCAEGLLNRRHPRRARELLLSLSETQRQVPGFGARFELLLKKCDQEIREGVIEPYGNLPKTNM